MAGCRERRARARLRSSIWAHQRAALSRSQRIGVRGAAVIVEPYAVAGAPAQVMRAAMAGALARSGASAMLIPSAKPDRMLDTSAFGFYPGAPLPVLSVAKEDVLFLRRLLASGPGPGDAGRRQCNRCKPRAGAQRRRGDHGDDARRSGARRRACRLVDPGQGAQDDGVGVAAVLEAARILKSLGIKPRRTIRFAFFSGEEQGASRVARLCREAPQRARWAARSRDHGLGCADAARVPDSRTFGHRSRREDRSWLHCPRSVRRE